MWRIYCADTGRTLVQSREQSRRKSAFHGEEDSQLKKVIEGAQGNGGRQSREGVWKGQEQSRGLQYFIGWSEGQPHREGDLSAET